MIESNESEVVTIEDILSENIHNNSLFMDNISDRQLIINNLAALTTSNDLKTLFSKYGPLEDVHIIKEHGLIRALIKFIDPQSALKAKEDGLNNKIQLHNRVLLIESTLSPLQSNTNSLQIKKRRENSPGSSNGKIDRSINKLNEDCLVCIFKYLPVDDKIRIERVSKLWRSASLKSWSRVKFLRNTRPFDEEEKDETERETSEKQQMSRFYETFVDISVIQKLLLRCGRFLERIDITSKDVNINEQTLVMLPAYCRNLEQMKIKCISTLTCLRGLAYGCHQLKLLHVTFRGCRGYQEEDFSKIFRTKNRLEEISINSYRMTGECLMYLPDTIERICLLNCISNCSTFSEAIKKFTKLQALSLYKGEITGLLPALENSCKRSLQVLELLACDLDAKEELSRIGQLENLKHLFLFARWITDPLLSNLAQQCKKLSSVCLTDSVKAMRVSERGIQAIASLPELQVLEMTGICITGESLKRMQKLRKFKCNDCSLLTDDALCEFIKNAPNLEFLGARNYNFAQNHCKVLRLAAEVTEARNNGVCLEIKTCMNEKNWIDVQDWIKESPRLRIINVRPANF